MTLKQSWDQLGKEKSNFDKKELWKGNWEYTGVQPHSQSGEFKQILDKMDEILKTVKAGFNQNGYTKSNGIWVKL